MVGSCGHGIFYSHVLPQAQASFPDDISNICIMAKYNQYRRDKYAYDKSHAPVVIKEEDCLICHLCELLCPEFAIYVTQKHDEVMNE